MQADRPIFRGIWRIFGHSGLIGRDQLSKRRKAKIDMAIS